MVIASDIIKFINFMFLILQYSDLIFVVFIQIISRVKISHVIFAVLISEDMSELSIPDMRYKNQYIFIFYRTALFTY